MNYSQIGRIARSAAIALACIWGAGALAESQTFITPYPGSGVHGTWTHNFDQVVLPAGKVHFDDKTQNDVVDNTVKVEGKVTYTSYDTPENLSGLEVFQNYKQGLQAGGFKILFSCYQSECTKGEDSGYILDRNQFQDDPSAVGSSQTGYLTAKLARPQGDVYATVIVDQGNATDDVLVVEAKPMKTGMIKVDVKALSNDIGRTGHAAIYGIYFDTNKAALKPQSAQALGQIAKLMTEQPKLRLYVVGNTDNVGALKYNMDLSLRRAKAVVAALVHHYRIAANRLEAEGIGPLAPVMANTTDAGRAKNRRVELVVQ